MSCIYVERAIGGGGKGGDEGARDGNFEIRTRIGLGPAVRFRQWKAARQ